MTFTTITQFCILNFHSMPLQLKSSPANALSSTATSTWSLCRAATAIMGILPHHAPVLSTLKAGELRVKIGNDSHEFAIGGGFVEIQANHVIILADSAERADEIDMARAEAARNRAEEMLKNPPPNKEDLYQLEVAAAQKS